MKFSELATPCLFIIPDPGKPVQVFAKSSLMFGMEEKCVKTADYNCDFRVCRKIKQSDPDVQQIIMKK